MNKEAALQKIKKCLRLSKSNNEHEAAQALKHAQVLMSQYGITSDDVDLLDVTEAEFACAKMLSKWQFALVSTIKKAFGVNAYLGLGTKANIVFYGIGSKPELAIYAYEVLLRQIRKDRRNYMTTTLKYVRLTKNKIYRADQFCLGWVTGVYHLIDKFNVSEKEQEILKKYTKGLELKATTPKTIKPSSNAKQAAMTDWDSGYNASENAKLHRSMNGSKQAVLGIEK